MEKYYLERNNLLQDEFIIDFFDLKKYFYQVYKYFDDRELFEVAFKGVWKIEKFNSKESQICPPTMAPTPELFFINHLEKDDVYPIWEHYETYEEEELFTIIEILFEHICKHDDLNNEFLTEEYQKEFAVHINNLLKRYNNGYYLDETHGFIMEQPNDAVNNLLHNEILENMAEGVMGQMKTAVKMFYRFNSDEELKKKAINILADILEPLRNELKDLLNEEYEVSKNEHDKLIFGIVNRFNIRHNNKNQFTKYNKAIWYDWMMQYYTSVIITYYKLKQSY